MSAASVRQAGALQASPGPLGIGPRIALVVALLAGGAMVFAFAPVGLWPLAPLSLLMLWLLLPGGDTPADARGAARLGFAFGVGYFGLGVSWVYHSLHLFGGAAALFAIFLTAVFVGVMTLFPALVAWAFVRLRVGLRARLRADPDSARFDGAVAPTLSEAWLFAALWALSELLRNAIMGGFPWILIGYSQTSGPLGPLAPVIGVYGIGFLLLVCTLSVPVLLRAGATRSRVGAAATLLMSAGAVVLAFDAPFTQPKSAALGVRLAQANIPQAMKFSRERLKRSLDDYLALSVTDLPDDIRLIVWPETAIPTGFANVEDYIAPTVAALHARGVDVLAGGFDRDGEDSYNAVRQLGGERQVYRKRHIVPFGEYLPLRGLLEVFSALIVVPGSDLSRGRGPHVPLEVAGESIGVSICYEDVFGEEMRPLLPASTVLVNVSNDAWFGDSFAPHQHEQKARMRAREMGRPMVRVTNTGVSSAITYHGDILGRIDQGEAGVLDVHVTPRTGTTPYVRFGNGPVLVVSSLLVGVALVMTVRRRHLPGSRTRSARQPSA